MNTFINISTGCFICKKICPKICGIHLHPSWTDTLFLKLDLMKVNKGVGYKSDYKRHVPNKTKQEWVDTK
jgi:hypothetical protein